MAMNIEQRLEQSAKSIEQSSQKAHDFAEKDTTLQTCAGSRDSLPKVSRIWQENFARQMNKHATEFQDRFALSQQSLPWQAGITVSDSLQRYHVGVQGEEGYKEFLPNPVKLPFETAATLQDDLTQDRWLENGVPNKHWTERKVASALEKSLGMNVRIWPKDRDLQVGDVIPSAQETADGLPITHVIVDGNAYAMSPLASGLVSTLSDTGATIGGVGVYIHQFFGDKIEAREVLQNNTEQTSEVQRLQDISELLRKPIDFTGVENVTVSTVTTFSKWLHWVSDTNDVLRLKYTADTRAEIAPHFGYIVKKDNAVSIEQCLLEDVHLDFSNSRHGFIPIDNLIQGILVTADGAGCFDRDVIAIRAKFTNPRGDAMKVETVNGGKARGVRQLFCIGDVDSPRASSLRSNMLRTFNGDEENPGEYGVYTISDVTSFGNYCRGMRSCTDFKRGTENFVISQNTTVDMSDCHHSVDGVRNGVFDASNHGSNGADSTQAVKNFFEAQGENIEIFGGTLNVGDDCPLPMTGGFFITDYAYPSENGTGVGNRRNQSVNINIHGGKFNKIANHAVRLINPKNCSVQHVNGEDILWDVVSFEKVDNVVDKNGQIIEMSGNSCDMINSVNCRSCASTQSDEVVFGSSMFDENKEYSIYNYSKGNFRFNFEPENLNKNELIYNGSASPLLWSTGGNSVIYTVESDIPVDAASTIGMEDNRTDIVMPSNYSGKIGIKLGQRLYFKALIKGASTTRCGIIIREYDVNNTVIANKYVPFDLSLSLFQIKLGEYICESANCSYVKVIITPADYSNAPSATGKILLSWLKFGRKPF